MTGSAGERLLTLMTSAVDAPSFPPLSEARARAHDAMSGAVEAAEEAAVVAHLMALPNMSIQWEIGLRLAEQFGEELRRARACDLSATYVNGRKHKSRTEPLTHLQWGYCGTSTELLRVEKKALEGLRTGGRRRRKAAVKIQVAVRAWLASIATAQLALMARVGEFRWYKRDDDDDGDDEVREWRGEFTDAVRKKKELDKARGKEAYTKAYASAMEGVKDPLGVYVALVRAVCISCGKKDGLPCAEHAVDDELAAVLVQAKKQATLKMRDAAKLAGKAAAAAEDSQDSVSAWHKRYVKPAAGTLGAHVDAGTAGDEGSMAWRYHTSVWTRLHQEHAQLRWCFRFFRIPVPDELDAALRSAEGDAKSGRVDNSLLGSVASSRGGSELNSVEQMGRDRRTPSFSLSVAAGMGASRATSRMSVHQNPYAQRGASPASSQFPTAPPSPTPSHRSVRSMKSIASQFGGGEPQFGGATSQFVGAYAETPLTYDPMERVYVPNMFSRNSMHSRAELAERVSGDVRSVASEAHNANRGNPFGEQEPHGQFGQQPRRSRRHARGAGLSRNTTENSFRRPPNDGGTGKFGAAIQNVGGDPFAVMMQQRQQQQQQQQQQRQQQQQQQQQQQTPPLGKDMYHKYNDDDSDDDDDGASRDSYNNKDAMTSRASSRASHASYISRQSRQSRHGSYRSFGQRRNSRSEGQRNSRIQALLDAQQSSGVLRILDLTAKRNAHLQNRPSLTTVASGAELH
jgi:hypothetical protein